MLDWVAVLNLVFAATFVFLVVWAMVSDATRLVIPNWVSLFLVGQFLLFAILIRNEVPLFYHFGVAALIFTLAFAAYRLNWMAGGDVKFLAALSLWAGPAHIFPMILLMSLAGIALGLIVISGTIYLRWDGAGAPASGVSRLFPHWLRRGLIPYGVAIGTGALGTIPAIF